MSDLDNPDELSELRELYKQVRDWREREELVSANFSTSVLMACLQARIDSPDEEFDRELERVFAETDARRAEDARCEERLAQLEAENATLRETVNRLETQIKKLD